MNTTFNERKATQLAAIVLESNGGQMDVLDLMKQLYCLDRESFLKFRNPCTGDAYVSMPRGMVLSQSYNLSKGHKHFPPTFWETCIERVPKSYTVMLKRDPGHDEFSEEELTFVREKAKEVSLKSRDEMINWVHHKLPEWIKPPEGTKRVLIEYEYVLRKALDLEQPEIDRIAHKAEVRSMFKSAI